MGAFDTSMYQQNPLRSVADYEGDYQKQAMAKQMLQQNALALKTGEMGLQEKQRELASANALRDVGMSFGQDPQANAMMILQKTGDIKAAQAYMKSVADQAKVAEETRGEAVKTQGLTDKQKRDAIQFNLQSLSTVNNPQQYAAWLDGGAKSGLMTPEEVAAQKAQIPQTPAEFAQLKQQQMLAGVELAKQFDIRAAAARDAESGRHNKAAEANAAGQLGVSRANLGLARERLNVDKAAPKGVIYEGADGPMLVDPRAGTAVPITAGGAPLGSKADAKPLPAAVTKQLTEVRDNAATIARLNGSFKSDFAGKGVLGLGGDAQMMVSGNVGADKEAVEWWKNYRKESELVERHALFGAALTPGEQSSWRSADIAPGMNPEVVKRNLETRAALSKKVLENTQADLVDAGHSGKRIGAIAGRGAQEAAPVGGSYGDAEKERRYQEWKAKQK